jgi:hypothetical protein
MHARLAMNVGHRTYQLGEYPFHFIDREGTVAQEVIVKLIAYRRFNVSSYLSTWLPRVALLDRHTSAVFQHQPHQILSYNDFVEARDMRVKELTMMMDLTC